MAEKPDNVLYEYNISSRGAPTLVGNWVEERALQQISTESADEIDGVVLTKTRVMAHSNEKPASCYETTSMNIQSSMMQEFDRELAKAGAKTVGKRTARIIEQLREKSKYEERTENIQPSFQSESHGSFSRHDTCDIVPGQRTMKTQDGVGCRTTGRSITRKHQLIDPTMETTPITLHTLRAHRENPKGHSQAVSLFAKSSVFSKPIHDPMKIIDNE